MNAFKSTEPLCNMWFVMYILFVTIKLPKLGGLLFLVPLESPKRAQVHQCGLIKVRLTMQE